MSSKTALFGSLFSTPQKNGLTRPKAVRGSGIPMVNMGELFAYPRIKNLVMDLVMVSDSEAHFLLEPEDLLFARQSLVLEGAGQCSIFLGNKKPTVFESHLIRCRLSKSISNPYFYFYFFRSPAGRAAIETIAEQGAGASGIRGSDLVKLAVPCPPKEQQDAVAAVLTALDDRIDILRETNTTLEAIAQALFKSWFVDFDPVRAKLEGRAPECIDEATAALFPDGFEESQLGLVPRGWIAAPLTAIASVVMGLSPKGDSYNANGVGTPLVNGPVEFGDYFPVKTKWTTSADRLTSQGDLIFCVRGSTTGKRVISDGVYCIGRGVCAIRAVNRHHGFLYQTMNFGLDRLLSKTTGSVFPSLSGPDIKNFLVLKPSDGVVAAYEDLTSPLLHRLQEGQHQAQTLAALRDTLLPRLFSGQLRISSNSNSELEPEFE